MSSHHEGTVTENPGTSAFTGSFTTGASSLLRINGSTGGAKLNAFVNNGTHAFTGDLDNQGSLEIVSRPLNVRSTNDFLNSGFINVGSGLTLTTSGGAFTNTITGTIEGAGTVDVSSGAQFINLGTVGPGDAGTLIGRLTFVDFLPFDAQSDLNVEPDGLIPGSEHDQVVVSGSATLNGALSLAFLGGYTPQDGDTFTILTCSGTCTGSLRLRICQICPAWVWPGS